MIPLCDVTQQHAEVAAEIEAALLAAARSGRYILGPEVEAFERELADYCGVRFAVGVGSGTDALHLALRALGIGPGDEVVTTPFTFVATTEAIGLVGATPVFVDVDPHTFNIDADLIEAALTRRTKAILPVHLYGRPCDMAPIMAIAQHYGLRVIEDCAQSLGATYDGAMTGTLGDVGCLSFFPSKNLGCLGDGGMVITDNPHVRRRVEMLRRHGGRVKYHHSELGLNSRLDEIQAAVLRVKLRKLDAWNAKRREAARAYDGLLRNVPSVQMPPRLEEAEPNHQIRSVYHQYTVKIDDRDGVRQRMQERGVQTFPYYPVPLHLQEVHAGLGYGPGSFPAAESVARRCLSLPMFPGVSRSQQETVVAALRDECRSPGEHLEAA